MGTIYSDVNWTIRLKPPSTGLHEIRIDPVVPPKPGEIYMGDKARIIIPTECAIDEVQTTLWDGDHKIREIEDNYDTENCIYTLSLKQPEIMDETAPTIKIELQDLNAMNPRWNGWRDGNLHFVFDYIPKIPHRSFSLQIRLPPPSPYELVNKLYKWLFSKKKLYCVEDLMLGRSSMPAQLEGDTVSYHLGNSFPATFFGFVAECRRFPLWSFLGPIVGFFANSVGEWLIQRPLPGWLKNVLGN